MFESVECNSIAELSQEQRKFLEFSQEVHSHVSVFSWEITKIIHKESTWKSIISTWSTPISNNNWKENWKWWEKKSRQILNWFSQMPKNHLWDLESKNQIVECKCWKRNYWVVIRENQLINLSELEDFKNVCYSLIYYQIVNWNKVVDKMFIFPIELIRFYYNTTRNTRIYSKTGFFKRLYHWRCDKFFERDLWFRKRIFQMWWAQIKILEKPEDNIQISWIAKEII